MTSFIDIANVKKFYGSTEVLRGVNLKIAPQEQLVIRGSSGSGKSTLLYLIGGLELLSGGSITVDGHMLSNRSEEQLADYRNRTVGFIFQFHYLLPSMNCWDNILLPAQIGNFPIEDVHERSLQLAKELQVQHCLKKYPFEMSGGEQQRVNIIRALSLRPKLLLCDEPTGNLDSKNSERVTDILKELAPSFGATLLVVTHDRKVAEKFPREVYIEDGQLVN